MNNIHVINNNTKNWWNLFKIKKYKHIKDNVAD